MNASISSSITPAKINLIHSLLHPSLTFLQKNFPGDPTSRQPVHTVYGGAHLFKSDSLRKLGDIALRTLQQYAGDSHLFSQALGIPPIPDLFNRVQEKLKNEAVEDYRIDFEDGYGNRPDEEEDHHAQVAAEELAHAISVHQISPFIGIRIKPLTLELFSRSVRTLDLFVSTLSQKLDRKFPSSLIVTLPKVTCAEQVTALAQLLDALEESLNLPRFTLKIEIMVETPQSLFTPTGEAALPQLISASQGRCLGAHFGTYDYTAACGIVGTHQSMLHPACSFAKNLMQVTLAGTGVFLSDGATQILPIGPHRPMPGLPLQPEQMRENQRVVYGAWKTHYENIRNSLIGGFYQGWDLHPAQIPVRYAAVYTFFSESLSTTSARLKAFTEKTAQATVLGDTFDDAATGQGLLNFFLRGLSCGALTESQVTATGLSIEEIRTRSFLKIISNRRGMSDQRSLIQTKP